MDILLSKKSEIVTNAPSLKCIGIFQQKNILMQNL